MQIIATPVSANTAAHILAQPRKPNRMTISLIAMAITTFWRLMRVDTRPMPMA